MIGNPITEPRTAKKGKVMDQAQVTQILKDVAAQYTPPEQAERRGKRVNRIAHKFGMMFDACNEKDVSKIELMDIGGGAALFSSGAAGLGMKRVVLVDDYDDPEVHSVGDDLLALHKKLGVDIHSRDAVREGIMDIEGQFDVITSFDSMEHWHNSPKKLFSQVMQKLKPGGMLLLNAPNCVSLRKRITVPLGRGQWSDMADWYEQETFRGHVREPDVATLKYIAKDIGLKDYKIKGRNFIIYNRLGLTSALLPKIDPLNMFPSLCADLFLIGYKEG